MKNPQLAVGYLLLVMGIGLILYGFTLYPEDLEAPPILIMEKGE